jgi:homoserine O-acetyltransferase
MASEEYLTYDLGDFKLKSGGVIPKAQIAYKTFGEPNLPVLIYPSWYSGGKSFLSIYLGWIK